ncbi:PepSY domain-containing protein [Brevibacillus sp. IT-7CA2]|uniref:YcdB/YcdC domain-containing protein n=1 Tax=Brevibacillus sp. IT-7CA2 TaxID=3026436 RepID=UPI0039DF898A
MITYPTEAVRETMEKWFATFPGLREMSHLKIRTCDKWRVCEIRVGHNRTELEIDKETGYVMDFDLDEKDREWLPSGEPMDAESATERAIEVAEKLYGDHLNEMVRGHLAKLREYRERKQWELYYSYFFHGIPHSGVSLRIALDESGNLVDIRYHGFHDFDRKNKPPKPEVITKEEAKQAYLALVEKNMMLICDEQEEGKLKYIPDEAPLDYVVIHAKTGQVAKTVIGRRRIIKKYSEVIPIMAQGESLVFANLQEIEQWVKEHFQLDLTHAGMKRETLVTPNEDGETFNPMSGYFRFVAEAREPGWPSTIHYFWPLPEDEEAETVYDPDVVWVTLNRTTNELLAFTVNQKIEYIAPRLSEHDALQIAKRFLEKYIEQGITELHYYELCSLRGTGITYYFYERRQGIVLTNRVYSVKVNPWTGQVTGFYKHDARKNKEIPDPSSVVSTRRAAESFLRLFDIELEYVQVEDRGKSRREKAPVPIPIYQLKYTCTERYKYFDAMTSLPGR